VQHHWVCENDKNPTIAHQLFWSGNIVGYIIWGYTNDNFGRRPTVLLSHIAYFLGGLLTLFSPYFWLIGISRFMVGMAHHTVSHLPYLIAVEYCGVKTRTYPLVAVMAAYTTASLAIPLLAKILPAWRSLKMIAVFPNLLVIAAHFLGWIPESLSWLLCKNKVEEAQSTIHSVARINGIDLKGQEKAVKALLNQACGTDQSGFRALSEKEDLISHSSGYSGGEANTGIRALLARANAKFIVRIVLAVTNTFVGFVAYYGHASNTSNLGSNMHLSFVFAALVEIPTFSIPFIINYFGRRWTLFVCFLTSGAMSIFYVSTPSDLTHLALTFALLGRMFATGAYYVCLQYSSELFPTAIRGSGSSLCEIVGGIGLFISPWIVYLAKVQVQLPLLIFGAISSLGAVVTLFLPETCNENLPNTIEDANQFGSEQSFGHCVVCTNTKENLEQVSNNNATAAAAAAATLRKRIPSLVPSLPPTLSRIPTLQAITVQDPEDVRLVVNNEPSEEA